MISIVIWLLLSVLWGVIGWKNKMQTHLVPQSNELRCCDAYIEVILHDMRDLSSGSPDWGSNDVHLGVHHCDWYLRSYMEDIRRPISLGWKKSGLLWLVLIKMRFGSCMLSAFENRWFGLDEFVEGFFNQAVKNRFSGSIFMLDLPLCSLAVTDAHLRQIEA